uniref:Si:dkeyp-72e1.6 n=1 Tax=Lates calcarifer TaxID=8187 RepID=A0A4W6D562_LATCA
RKKPTGQVVLSAPPPPPGLSASPVYRGLGRCVCCFWLAVAFDIVGLLVLLIGVFVNVFFYDLLIYAGAIVIFLSLIWWVFWYSGNIEVPPAELEDDVGLLKKDKGGLSGISGAVRRLSSRVSSGFRNSFRRNGGPSGTSGRAQGQPPGRRWPHRRNRWSLLWQQ